MHPLPIRLWVWGLRDGLCPALSGTPQATFPRLRKELMRGAQDLALLSGRMARAPTWGAGEVWSSGRWLSPVVPPLDLLSGASKRPGHRPAGLLTTKVAGARLCGTGTMKHCQCPRAWIPGLPWPPWAPPPAQAGQVPPRSNMLVSIFPQGLLQGSPDGVRGTPDAAMTLSLHPPTPPQPAAHPWDE